MIGHTLAHYRITAAIGAGGMGEVYRATDTKLGRDVALKVLPAEMAARPERLERFRREAKALAALDHPGIVTVHSVEEADGVHFLTMQLVEGQPLDRLIPEGGLPVDRILEIATALAEALAAAHDKGIVHRDLKPGNVMVAKDGRVKVLDFGLARMSVPKAEEPTGSELPTELHTREGVVMGTVPYMSPEQVSGRDVDHRTDIFSLGIILYEMATGRRPFQGRSSAELASAILRDPPPPLGGLRADLPEGLARVIQRCLEKSPEDRFPSARVLHADLETLRSHTRPSLGTRLRRPLIVVPLAAGLLLAAGLAARVASRAKETRWARQQALPEIARLAEAEQFVEAFALAQRAEAAIPGDPMLARLWPTIARTPSVRSRPEGATVSYKDYASPAAAWVVAGVTPLEDVRVPAGFLRWQFEKTGFETLEVAGPSGPLALLRGNPWTPDVRLEATAEATPGMILVPGSDEPHPLFLPGFEHLDPVHLGDAFWMDEYEVTNEEFKGFVDAGGYGKPEYWLEPFEEGGRSLSRDEATSRFRDATGRPGPANWVQGEFPAGQGRLPVSGVSWYEAAAYARFVGKRLPTLHHWTRAAVPQTSSWVVPRANFSSSGPVPVGSRDALHQWGHHDLAGNVKEWLWTGPGDGRHYILGGGWDEPPYMFNEPDARSPFARTSDSGFRCVRYAREPTSELLAPVAWSSRDYHLERPAPEPVFEIYRRLYAYDRVPLRAPVEATDDSDEHWRREQVSVPTAYGPGRMKIFLYLPKTGTPPFRTVVYFPGASMLRTRSLDQIPVSQFDFIVKSGRAVVFPVYRGTFDRPSDVSDSTANPSAGYRDHVIAWSQDFMRAVDYLETRPDLAVDRLAFVGLSWGARMGTIVPALDHRVKVAVLFVGGFSMQRPMPEVDQINFAPRVRIPVLMLNGRFDFFFPVDASQKPMFETLGTPAAQKRHLLYDTGHGIPRVEMIKETLDWLDRYQPAKTPSAPS